MESEQWFRGNKTLIEIEGIEASLDHLDDPGHCIDCQSPTIKSLVEYNYGGKTYWATAMLPGYKCLGDDCGVGYLVTGLADLFLYNAINELAALGDEGAMDDKQRRDNPPEISFTSIPPEILKEIERIEKELPESY